MIFQTGLTPKFEPKLSVYGWNWGLLLPFLRSHAWITWILRCNTFSRIAQILLYRIPLVLHLKIREWLRFQISQERIEAKVRIGIFFVITLIMILNFPFWNVWNWAPLWRRKKKLCQIASFQRNSVLQLPSPSLMISSPRFYPANPIFVRAMLWFSALKMCCLCLLSSWISSL